MGSASNGASAGPTQPFQAGLARIAGHSAAIAAEADRLFGLPPAAADGNAAVTAMLDEMRAMSRLLAESRAEIVAMSPPPGGGVQLQQAGDTLDAVVGETECATLEIMTQAERAQAAAARLHAGTSPEIGADLAEVNEAATAIVLACIFQDVTGQRIRKVMTTMRDIEARIAALVTLMGIEASEFEAPAAAPTLLNGPSSAAEGGLGQCAVDDLFG
jgi:chemotaxis protein CheZ